MTDVNYESLINNPSFFYQEYFGFEATAVALKPLDLCDFKKTPMVDNEKPIVFDTSRSSSVNPLIVFRPLSFYQPIVRPEGSPKNEQGDGVVALEENDSREERGGDTKLLVATPRGAENENKTIKIEDQEWRGESRANLFDIFADGLASATLPLDFIKIDNDAPVKQHFLSVDVCSKPFNSISVHDTPGNVVNKSTTMTAFLSSNSASPPRMGEQQIHGSVVTAQHRWEETSLKGFDLKPEFSSGFIDGYISPLSKITNSTAKQDINTSAIHGVIGQPSSSCFPAFLKLEDLWTTQFSNDDSVNKEIDKHNDTIVNINGFTGNIDSSYVNTDVNVNSTSVSTVKQPSNSSAKKHQKLHSYGRCNSGRRKLSSKSLKNFDPSRNTALSDALVSAIRLKLSDKKKARLNIATNATTTTTTTCPSSVSVAVNGQLHQPSTIALSLEQQCEEQRHQQQPITTLTRPPPLPLTISDVRSLVCISSTGNGANQLPQLPLSVATTPSPNILLLPSPHLQALSPSVSSQHSVTYLSLASPTPPPIFTLASSQSNTICGGLGNMMFGGGSLNLSTDRGSVIGGEELSLALLINVAAVSSSSVQSKLVGVSEPSVNGVASSPACPSPTQLILLPPAHQQYHQQQIFTGTQAHTSLSGQFTGLSPFLTADHVASTPHNLLTNQLLGFSNGLTGTAINNCGGSSTITTLLVPAIATALPQQQQATSTPVATASLTNGILARLLNNLAAVVTSTLSTPTVSLTTASMVSANDVCDTQATSTLRLFSNVGQKSTDGIANGVTEVVNVDIARRDVPPNQSVASTNQGTTACSTGLTAPPRPARTFAFIKPKPVAAGTTAATAAIASNTPAKAVPRLALPVPTHFHYKPHQGGKGLGLDSKDAQVLSKQHQKLANSQFAQAMAHEVHITEGLRGEPKLHFGGYVYTKRKANDYRMLWWCVYRTSDVNCYGTLTTTLDMRYPKVMNDHKHQPDYTILQKELASLDTTD